MKRSNRLILLVGVLLAAVAFVGVILLSGNKSPGQNTQQPTTAATVLAAQDIPLGTVVTEGMVKVEDKPLTSRDAGAFSDTSLVLGKTARRNIVNGQQITATDFQASGAVTQIDTPAGMRAIAIQVDQTSGVGTVIRAGDYVDMLVGITGDKFPVVTTSPDNPNQVQVVSGLSNTSVKLLLQGMQVLGTLLPPPSAAQQQQQQQQGQQGQQGQGGQSTALTGQQEIVIVAATPQQAEVIKFAQLDGSISLVLRSAQEFQQRDENNNVIPPAPDSTTGIILRTLIDQYGVLVPELVEANARTITRP